MIRRNVVIVELSDILEVAFDIGYEWNKAYDILAKEPLVFSYGETTFASWNISEFSNSNPHEFSVDTLNIMNAFCAKHNLTEFSILS